MWPSFKVRSQQLSEISINMYFEILAKALYDVMNFESFLQTILPAMADRAEI